jgi:predicted MFS family arabinose efflux permease
MRKPRFVTSLLVGMGIGGLAGLLELGWLSASGRDLLAALAAGAAFGIVLAAAVHFSPHRSVATDCVWVALGGAAAGAAWWYVIRPPSSIIVAMTGGVAVALLAIALGSVPRDVAA